MSSRAVTITVFVALFASMGVVDILARKTSLRVPPFASMVRRVMRHRSAQFGVLLLWWWFGAHFFIN
jgi:hypothetical protein